MVLIQRINPYIEQIFSVTQTGFREGRGVQTKEDDDCIINYIDFVAAFDLINHSYMLESLKRCNASLKYIRLVKSIYSNTTLRVRIPEVGGNRV